MMLDGTIKIQDTRYIFRPLFERRAARDVSLPLADRAFRGARAESCRAPMLARMVAVLGNFCDEARVAEIEGFFRPRLAARRRAPKST